MTDKDKLFIHLQHESYYTPEIELVLLPTQYRLYDRITGEIVGFTRNGKWDIKRMLKVYNSYIRDYTTHPQHPIAFTYYLDLPKPRKVYFEIEVHENQCFANFSFDKNMEDDIYTILGVNSLYEIIANAKRYCPEDNVVLCHSYSDMVIKSESISELNTLIMIQNLKKGANQ